MFSTAANPYDESIIKATDENLASEDWALNLEVCDKVTREGQAGARNAVGALQKRLTHRNPNVQLYALELANTLAQNCGKPLLEELSSRNWTGALDRLVNDRATVAPVKKKALGYIKAWAKQFEDSRDPNLGMMGELYDQLRAKNFAFDEPEPAPESGEDTRHRQEEEELQRVLELSKQDKGGRGGGGVGGGSYVVNGGGGGTSSSAYPSQPAYNSQPSYTSQSQPAQSYQPQPQPQYQPEPQDINSATRVRALYTFTSAEVGELNFDRGDIIKVLDRGFKEWWRGACNGRIGIFPVTYVEAVPEPTPKELQEEAQEEARVFASLGLVDQLLQTLKSIDPSKGERLDDKPEIEEMYQASVGLQGQINALIKKYSDQKAELEHMNANFLRAMKQYEELRAPQHQGYALQDTYAQYQQQPYPPQQQQQQQQYPPANSQPQPQAQPPQSQLYASQSDYPQAPTKSYPTSHFPQPTSHQSPGAGAAPIDPSPGTYFNQHQGNSQTNLHRVPTGAPSFPPQSSPHRQGTEPGAAGLGAGGSDPAAEHKAAWDAYYRQLAEQQQGEQQGQSAYGESPYPPQGQGSQEHGSGGFGQSPYPPHPQSQPQPQPRGSQESYGQPPYPPQGLDGVAGGMGRMSVHGQ